MRNARDHSAEDDRRDHHLDELDEAVAERLDPVIGCKSGPQPADHDTKQDGEQHLDIKDFVPGLRRLCRLRLSDGRCRHDLFPL
jgi:hypothetical protein